ncbi:MAG TPA: nickel-responsive transcriptional regulator NikR, partial [Bacteroidales bacterium]|nr:nickel-responsive transcriptional regulator NikR [Bacteroidales bacterium]HRC89819.1 nickel-responsive transcriptional regulator NikR [Bacteroidales bacterium]
SLEEDLLKELDIFVKENAFPNRSQALRHLIEKNVIEKKWQCNNVVAGAIVMIYDRNKKEVLAKSNEIQHEYFEVILSLQHFHLSHDICMEIITVRGKAKILTELSDRLIAIKGIKHGKLVMSKAD